MRERDRERKRERERERERERGGCEKGGGTGRNRVEREEDLGGEWEGEGRKK